MKQTLLVLGCSFTSLSLSLPNTIAPVSSTSETISKSWGTRGGAGVVFYFK